MESKNYVELKVAEAVQDDVNKGIVRVDSTIMKEMNLRPGEVVEIRGESTTVGLIDRAYPGDIGLNIIRMDGLIRRNAKTGIGETVKVLRADVKEAKKVMISPAKEGIQIKAPPQLFKQGLLGRAVLKNDIVSLGGTRRRRTTMSQSPFYDDNIFNILDEGIFGGFGFGDIKFVVTDVNPKQAVIITENTDVIFNPEAAEITSKEHIPEIAYEDVGGLDEEIKKVREMVELPLKHPELFERLGIEPPKGVLLHGPPGTGKTLLAKAVANETNSSFYLINGPEIMSKYYGQSEENLRKKFEEAEKSAPSIVFIDEIDAIASKREESKGEVERRVVAQMLALMDGLKSRGKVIVIAATNIPNALDPALRRPGRFDREIDIGVPKKEGRLNILKIHTRNMPLAKNVNLNKLAEITHGFVGADLASLAKEAAMILLRKDILPKINLKEDNEAIPQEVLEKLQLTQAHFIEALKVVRPSAMREILIEIPNVKWEMIGGLEKVKQELIEAIEWPMKKPEIFTRLGVSPPKGVLLYGPPGTGKTMIAKAIATESKANFILVNGPELLSKWVGESEKAVRKVFEKARQISPSIIFFDEIDSLAPRRSASSESKVTERVVNQILTEMDGLERLYNVTVLAATNRPDILDTALLRPGRFDRLIYTPIPDTKTRIEIFKIHAKNIPIDFKTAPKSVEGKTDKERFFSHLAKKTEGYVGADIESVCRESAMIALRGDIKSKVVVIDNFEEALNIVRPSTSKEIEETYKQLEKQFRMAKAREMEENKPSYFG